MKSEKTKKLLIELGSEYLAEKLIAISEYDEKISRELNYMVLKNDPKKLAKKISSQINGIKRRTSYVSWNQTHEFIQELDQIANVIEKDLLLNSPMLAINSIEELYAADESICERIDDSDGCIGFFYSGLSELWGIAWLMVSEDELKLLPQKIYYLLVNNSYGAKDKVIESSSKALGENGLKELEKIIEKNKTSICEYSLSWIYEAIADGLGDVDKYIDVVKKYSVINEGTVCDISERLIRKWRGADAIKWLLHNPDDISLCTDLFQFDPKKVSPTRRYKLLLDAYDSETMIEKSDELRWKLFEQTLSKEYYDGLLKHKEPKKIEEIKSKAYQFACESYVGSIGSLLNFLNEIKELDKAAEIIVKKYDRLNDSDYIFYRPLSKTLFTEGYHLSACLLRRKLIDGVLDRALSKYYKYAVSDLNSARRWSKDIKDWKGFQDHNQYMDMLKKNHCRKHAFWSKIDQ